MTINSRQNEIIKDVKKLHQKKFREEKKQFITEGERSVNEALITGSRIITVFVTNEYFVQEKNQILIKEIKKKISDIKIISNNVMEYIADTRNPSGILAVVSYDEIENYELDPNNPFLILDAVSDPGNTGTILRSSAAFGIKNVFLINNCVDVYNPKTVRSSAGSIFRIKPYIIDEKMLDVFFNQCASMRIRIISTQLSDDAQYLYDYKFGNSIGLILSNEAKGLSDNIKKYVDLNLKIRIKKNIESLNVSNAASVFLYEISRQLNLLK